MMCIIMSSQVYYISNGQIKRAKQKFTTCENDYEIIFKHDTQIIEVRSIDVSIKHTYNQLLQCLTSRMVQKWPFHIMTSNIAYKNFIGFINTDSYFYVLAKPLVQPESTIKRKNIVNKLTAKLYQFCSENDFRRWFTILNSVVNILTLKHTITGFYFIQVVHIVLTCQSTKIMTLLASLYTDATFLILMFGKQILIQYIIIFTINC